MTVVHVGPTEAEFIVSLVVVGVVGPALAAVATRWADRRKFDHERKLKASGDLIERIEGVAVALEELGASAAEARQVYLALSDIDPPKLWTLVRAAEDSYQHARGLTARLGMRPHADAELVSKAEAAASSLLESTRAIRTHLIRTQAARAATGSEPTTVEPLESVIENIERGYALTREYQTLARAAIGRLLDPPP
jgi:hypothetical protein